MIYGNRKLGVTLLFAALLLSSFVSEAPAKLGVMGEAAVLMDLHTGQVLWARNKNKSMAPASVTKILTGLVALERGRLDEVVTVSERAAGAKGSSIYLRPGDRLALEDLLYALLLRSANDAAVAIAEHIGGSVEKFADLMNATATRIGALDSHFLNPNGLPQKGHYTTAQDLALITRAALDNSKFREVVTTRTRPWKGAGWNGPMVNHNKLLWRYEGAIGVKTGYTVEAGQCVVAAAERGSEAYLAVVLKSRGTAIWSDAQALLDYGFDHHTAVEWITQGDTVLTSVINGDEVPLAAAKPVRYLFTADEPGAPRFSIALDELGPPIAKGDKVGRVIVLDDDRKVGQADLIATVDVPKPASLLRLLAWVGWGLAVLLFVRLRKMRRKNRYFFAGRRRIRL